MWLFGRVAHPHEHYSVNSATWYVTALVVLAVLASPATAAVAVLVLAIADPAAAVVGRKLGRTRLVGDRSLEGSLAFVVAGFAAAWVTLSVFHAELLPSSAFAVAIAASTTGAIGEQLSGPLDDNLVVPLAAAIGAEAALYWIA